MLRDSSKPFTFGSFNNCSKISPVTFELWARVLKAVPDSRIIIKASAMADQRTRDKVAKGLTDLGVDRSRIELVTQQIDLAVPAGPDQADEMEGAAILTHASAGGAGRAARKAPPPRRRQLRGTLRRSGP